MWSVTVLTLFPEMFPGPLQQSLAGKALEKGLWQLNAMNIRDFALSKHKTVDDKPFGGGNGMVMRPDVLANALDVAIAAYPKNEKPRLIYPSPRGKVFTQAKSQELLEQQAVIIICGRYEGIDERVIEYYGIEEISLGDFILSGGEIAAMAMIDTCIRQVSGVLKEPLALAEESFGDGVFAGLLEYPHYTRPAEWRGLKVPEVLVSGHHAEIKEWRLKQAEAVTKERRKDLWEKK